MNFDSNWHNCDQNSSGMVPIDVETCSIDIWAILGEKFQFLIRRNVERILIEIVEKFFAAIKSHVTFARILAQNRNFLVTVGRQNDHRLVDFQLNQTGDDKRKRRQNAAGAHFLQRSSQNFQLSKARKKGHFEQRNHYDHKKRIQHRHLIRQEGHIPHASVHSLGLKNLKSQIQVVWLGSSGAG